MKRLFRIAAIVSALAASCAFPRGVMAQVAEPFIGQTMTSAHDFCPVGWAPMNGQLMSIAQNTALFSLLGTRYGGDGKTTFALPTAKPIFTASGAPLTQCIALQGVFPARP